MLIVSGKIEIAPEGVEAACAAAVIMMRETRKENGCRVYEFSQLIEEPNVFRVYEEWDDAEALRAHGAAAHMADFRKALGEAGVVGRDVFTVSGGTKKSLG